MINRGLTSISLVTDNWQITTDNNIKWRNIFQAFNFSPKRGRENNGLDWKIVSDWLIGMDLSIYDLGL